MIRPHILFADDDCDIRELVQLQLNAAGFRVSTAANGVDVLRLVTTERFDALIMDYWMADVTGIELCREVRAFDQSTPILICSGALTEADKNAAMLAGAQGYIAKPFNASDLIHALRSILAASVDK